MWVGLLRRIWGSGKVGFVNLFEDKSCVLLELTSVGDGDISFNTFNTSSIVDAVNVDYPDPDEFHTIRATVEAEDSSNVVINYFLDGTLQSTQVGSDFVGSALWL